MNEKLDDEWAKFQEFGFYENKKSIKGNSLIFTSTSQWHCINENKKWLDKSCD